MASEPASLLSSHEPDSPGVGDTLGTSDSEKRPGPHGGAQGPLTPPQSAPRLHLGWKRGRPRASEAEADVTGVRWASQVTRSV